jgi:hypothetical protein
MTEEKKKGGNPAFVKGMKSLNPKGRPKGSVNKYTLLSREMMTEQGPAIVQKVMDMAMDGNVHCLKMCIDRILPVHKAVDANRAKQDSQIIINVGSSESLKEKIRETPKRMLKNPTIKDPDEVIIEIAEAIKVD